MISQATTIVITIQKKKKTTPMPRAVIISPLKNLTTVVFRAGKLIYVRPDPGGVEVNTPLSR